MHLPRILPILLAAALVLAGCIGAGSGDEDDAHLADDTPAGDDSFDLKLVAEGFTLPLQVVSANDGSGRLFVVEQDGLVKIVVNGSTLPEPFLDLSLQVSRAGWEQGLLSIAFDPTFPQRPFVYASYTNAAGANQIDRFRVDGDRVDAGSASRVFLYPQPMVNHNGGLILFGPDGYLYVGIGDGGLGDDPFQSGQNPLTLLGTILRIDVDVDSGYRVPADNPFVGSVEADEIWALGLRNPWRFSFDRDTADLWIGDVGQNAWEEINFQSADSKGGENYGWPAYEGSEPHRNVPTWGEDLVFPIAQYPNTGFGADCSVTGGHVYRGSAIPGLVGTYVLADFCSGKIWGVTSAGNGTDGGDEWALTLLMESGHQVSSFGEDEDGELFLVSMLGGVYRFAPPT